MLAPIWTIFAAVGNNGAPPAGVSSHLHVGVWRRCPGLDASAAASAAAEVEKAAVVLRKVGVKAADFGPDMPIVGAEVAIPGSQGATPIRRTAASGRQAAGAVPKIVVFAGHAAGLLRLAAVVWSAEEAIGK